MYGVYYQGERWGVYLTEAEAVDSCMRSRRKDGLLYYVEKIAQ